MFNLKCLNGEYKDYPILIKGIGNGKSETFIGVPTSSNIFQIPLVDIFHSTSGFDLKNITVTNTIPHKCFNNSNGNYKFFRHINESKHCSFMCMLEESERFINHIRKFI